MKSASRLTAGAIAIAVLQTVHAGLQPEPGATSESLYSSSGTFTLIEGIDRIDSEILFSQGTSVFTLNPDTPTPAVAGTLPANVSVADVVRGSDGIAASVGINFSSPFPYRLGVLGGGGVFVEQVQLDGVFDLAVNPAGDVYLTANPAGSGAVIYRYDPSATSLVAVATIGGNNGGIAFDSQGRLYAADLVGEQIVRFAPDQLAVGGLTAVDGEIVVSGVTGGYLAFDDQDRLFVTVDFGNALRLYDVETGAFIRTVADDDTFAFGIGRPVWLPERNQLVLGYNDFFATFSTELFLLTLPFVPGDYDRDGFADLTLYDPAVGAWYQYRSEEGFRMTGWGWREADPVSGDFDGDARADLAVYHPRGGNWHVLPGNGNEGWVRNWGWSEAVPVPGDYDGDGMDDLAVYHPATGTWYLLFSGGGSRVAQWGWSEAVPVPGDYDGDGTDDLAVYHAASGTWFMLLSGGGSMSVQWGWSEATPVPGDYDGDGSDDPAVYDDSDGTWYILASTGGPREESGIGGVRYRPVPGDYDGDGVIDPAAYRANGGQWEIRGSLRGEHQAQFGWWRARAIMPQ